MSVNPFDMTPPRPMLLSALPTRKNESQNGLSDNPATRSRESKFSYGVGVILERQDFSVKQILRIVYADDIVPKSCVGIGDVLYFVNDHPTQQVASDTIEGLIRGPKDSSVRLSFMSKLSHRLYHLTVKRHDGVLNAAQVWAPSNILEATKLLGWEDTDSKVPKEINVKTLKDENESLRQTIQTLVAENDRLKTRIIEFSSIAQTSSISLITDQDSAAFNSSKVLKRDFERGERSHQVTDPQYKAALHYDNDLLQRQIATLTGRVKELSEQAEIDRRAAYESSIQIRSALSKAEKARTELEQQKIKHKKELDEFTGHLVREAAENQSRAKELAILHYEISLLRDLQSSITVETDCMGIARLGLQNHQSTENGRS